MAVLPSKHSVQDHDTSQADFELLPTGIYALEVIASDLKSEEGTTNLAVNLTYAVVEPEAYAGRRFFAWIDYQHSDAKKQEDGQREISRLCRAVEYDRPDLEDTEDLHFIKFVAKVQNSPAGVSKKTGNPYKAKNRIQRFYYPDEGPLPEPAIDEVQPAAKPVAANNNQRPAANQNTPQAATKPAGSRPWAKGK